MNTSNILNKCSGMLIICAIHTAQTTYAFAQDPDIGPQVRVDTVGGTKSADETTASASDINPNEIIAGWNDYRNSGPIRSGFSLSMDAGKTWTGFILRPPAGHEASTEGDPMTAFDPRTGTLWAGAISFTNSGGLYIARKDPGNSQFQPSVLARGGFVDKCWLAAGIRPGQPDSTRLYCAYNEGVIWSDDMGTTWTNPRSAGSGGIGLLPRIGPEGELYIAYWDFGTGMMMDRSLNGGTTITTHRIATRMDVWGIDGTRFPGRFRVPPMVYLDVDENTGHLYSCYFDTTNIIDGNRNVDIYFTKSTDKGTTWTTPVVINTDSNPPGDQFFTWIEVDKQSRIHIVFLDSRHTIQDDNNVNGMFDAYYMFSSDEGNTWREYRLTPQSWNSANDGLGGFFLGDYLGLAVANNKAYPIYIDTTNGRAELYTNVISFGSTAAELISVEALNGLILDGDINSLGSSDDDYLHTQSGFGPTLVDLHNMELAIVAEAPGNSPTTIDLTIESRIDEPAGLAQIRMKNFNTTNFDIVGSYSIGNTDAVEVIEGIDASIYYNTNNGRMRVKIKHLVFVPFLAFTFESFIDQVEIVVE